MLLTSNINENLSCKPTVSVIIPTYNRVELLKHAVKSVLTQDFHDFEIIIVDNASIDKTREYVESIDDSRIKYVRNSENSGAAAARNIGIKLSRGRYIALLDDDDKWLPEKLKLQVEVLDNSDERVGIVSCGYIVVDLESGKELSRRINLNEGDLFEQMLYNNLIGNSSTPLIKRVCFDKVGLYDERYKSSIEDMDMYLRISKEFLIKAVNKPLVKYHKHPKIASKNYEMLVKANEIYLMKYEDLLKKINRKKYSYRLFMLGTYYSHCNQIMKAQKLFIRSIYLYPYNFRYYLHMLCSLLGTNVYSYISKQKQIVHY